MACRTGEESGEVLHRVHHRSDRHPQIGHLAVQGVQPAVRGKSCVTDVHGRAKVVAAVVNLAAIAAAAAAAIAAASAIRAVVATVGCRRRRRLIRRDSRERPARNLESRTALRGRWRCRVALLLLRRALPASAALLCLIALSQNCV